jgi:hypothetical protein
MTRSRSLPAFALAALTALAVAGCGGEKRIDDKKLESKIKQGIESQSGVKIKSVDCPGDRKLKKGDRFKCTARSTGGQTIPISVTQRDDKENVFYQAGG